MPIRPTHLLTSLAILATLAASAQTHLPQASLVDIYKDLHAHPELSFEEERASAWCADALEAAGFAVERGAGTACRRIAVPRA